MGRARHRGRQPARLSRKSLPHPDQHRRAATGSLTRSPKSISIRCSTRSTRTNSSFTRRITICACWKNTIKFIPSAIFDTMLAARLAGRAAVRFEFARGKISRRETGQRLAESRLGAAPADRADGNIRAQRHALSQAARRQIEARTPAKRPARVASGKLRAADCRLFAARPSWMRIPSGASKAVPF